MPLFLTFLFYKTKQKAKGLKTKKKLRGALSINNYISYISCYEAINYGILL